MKQLDKNLLNFLNLATDIILIVDNEKNIFFKNNFAKKVFSEIKNLSQIEHLFNFDICILDSENLLKYTPLSAAATSKEIFFADCIYQTSQIDYRNIILKSFNLENNKVLIFSDYTDSIALNQLEILKKENQKSFELIQKAENVALRASLVNAVSKSIRESIDINNIIKVVINETASTLQLFKAYYAAYNSKTENFEICFSKENNKISFNDDIKKRLLNDLEPVVSSVMEENELRSRLISPVVSKNELIGIIVLFRKNNMNLWTKDEIALVEGISSQLSTAIKQSMLFEKINSQNIDLEKTLEELHETQVQLIQSAKMASLGQLVAGVAHEINTPLGTITSNISIFEKCIKKISNLFNDEKDRNVLDILEETCRISKEAVNRINKIVKNLKNFARLDEADLKPVNVHEGIKSTLDLIRHELKNRIEVIEEYGMLPSLKCYPDLLNQVFMNLLVNATQSIEKEGTIKIKTEYKEKNIHIFIQDTGKGIKTEYLDKIFDPGFTTKGVGVGTGLGLSIVHKIIQKHNGQIKVTSKEN
ncbi:MAG: ATP-binding protein, partial [Candidatus Gastranaerophilaceae bacterium]